MRPRPPRPSPRPPCPSPDLAAGSLWATWHCSFSTTCNPRPWFCRGVPPSLFCPPPPALMGLRCKGSLASLPRGVHRRPAQAHVLPCSCPCWRAPARLAARSRTSPWSLVHRCVSHSTSPLDSPPPTSLVLIARSSSCSPSDPIRPATAAHSRAPPTTSPAHAPSATRPPPHRLPMDGRALVIDLHSMRLFRLAASPSSWIWCCSGRNPHSASSLPASPDPLHRRLHRLLASPSPHARCSFAPYGWRPVGRRFAIASGVRATIDAVGLNLVLALGGNPC